MPVEDRQESRGVPHDFKTSLAFRASLVMSEPEHHQSSEWYETSVGRVKRTGSPGAVKQLCQTCVSLLNEATTGILGSGFLAAIADACEILRMRAEALEHTVNFLCATGFDPARSLRPHLAGTMAV